MRMSVHQVKSRQIEELSFSPVEVSKKCSCTSCSNYSGAYTSIACILDQKITDQETNIISSDISKVNEFSGRNLFQSKKEISLKEQLKVCLCKMIFSINIEEEQKAVEDAIKLAESSLAAMRNSTSFVGSRKSVPCKTRNRKRYLKI